MSDVLTRRRSRFLIGSDKSPYTYLSQASILYMRAQTTNATPMDGLLNRRDTQKESQFHLQ